MPQINMTGREYDLSKDIILTLIEVAENEGTLSDHDFNEVIQAYDADEDEVMNRMAVSTVPYWKRYNNGWDLTNNF